MSFLAPLFLLGAFAVAFPLVFHLIRRISKEQVRFSSLRFLTPSPPRLTRKSRIEHWSLLLLRCAVIALLALVFARPFFSDPIDAQAGPGTSRKTALLIDVSASLQRTGFWDEARAAAEEVIRAAGPGDQLALLAFDRNARTLISFEDWGALPLPERRGVALSHIEALKPGWAGTHIGNAILSAVELLEEGSNLDDSAFQKEVILVTDLQAGAKLDGLQGFQWPAGVHITVRPLRGKSNPNAGLHLFTFQSPAASGALKARVVNSDPSRQEQFSLAWIGADPGKADHRVQVYVPPGQSRTVDLPKAPASHANALVLQGDAEPFDNTAYAAPFRAAEIRILFFTDTEPISPASPVYYIERAFQNSARRTFDISVIRPGDTLDPSFIPNAALVVVTDPLVPEHLPHVQEALTRGKTVLILLGGSAQGLSELTRHPNIAAAEASIPGYAIFGRIDFEHPLFAPFADPRFSDFTKIHTWSYRQLSGLPSGTRVLASFDSGDPAILELEAAEGAPGRILVFTFSWARAQSQFALSSKFVPFLYSLLEWSGGVLDQPSQYAVGDPVPLPSSWTGEVRVRKPDGTELDWPATQPYTQTSIPGIYTFTSGQNSFTFAVNVPLDESRTQPLDEDQLESLSLPVKGSAFETAEPAPEQRRYQLASEIEHRQKLWRSVLLAVLACLFVETWLAARLTRTASTELI